MQVQNEGQTAILPQTNGTDTIKQGGTYSANVKGKLAGKEALIQVKGQEMKVQYEGKLPDSGNVRLQVTDLKTDPPTVKVLPNNPLTTPQKASTLPEGTKQAIQILNQQQIPMTREMLQTVQKYMDKADGTVDQKLATIQQMAKKNLDFTPSQLKAVHETLHGTKLGEVLNELVPKEMKGTAAATSGESRELIRLVDMLKGLGKQVAPEKARLAQEIIRFLQTGGSESQALKMIEAEFAGELKANPDLAKVIANLRTVFPAAIISQIDGEQEISSISPQKFFIETALSQVKKQPQLEKLFATIQKGMDTLPIQQQQALAETLEKAEQLLANGKELAARQALAEGLTALETGEPQQVDAGANPAYQLSEEFLAAIPASSRDLLVTTITKKMSQAALDFKAVQRDISNALYTAEKMVQQSPVLARPSLETAIKQLDQAILKSDFMLYTDMTTEKKLLQASSQLHEAKKWLAAGESGKASEIVQQVRSTVDKIIFQPSDQRVKHFVAKQWADLQEEPLERQLWRTIEEPQQALRQEPTARHALEYLRQLGITRETDFAHSLLKANDADRSLKQVLMKLAESHGTGQKADQALQNVTGQQLLSKPDPSGLQTMMFSLPLILREQVENVKVFLQSKQSGQKMDWENCSLYFLLETKQVGDVGILLSATDRVLSVTLKNDSAGFEQKMSPLVETTKERLQEIGYQVGQIQFSSLKAEENKRETPVKGQPILSDRGYDYSV
ncbi:hypothetical protein J2Z23_000297 [Lederbergia galactosidilyticus]|uniref:hypothetical protein n=1 Tax=Lederbergia galactosidilytica TaxID=217031 RepID=UPI001AE19552|nr:hypothetical protein [Lederbergia galactosidilytica]MBP1913365.1 hypothetical protein [Lederbergia galactosidilytica]